MKKQVLVVDTKAGNLFSLRAAIERLDFDITIKEKPPTENFDAVVIPGQGRFGTVMRSITDNQWPLYFESLRESNIPMLGICVGMQIFFEGSEEDPTVPGLGWLKGKAQALNFPKKPMVGWADLTTRDLASSWPDEAVYFVNSYAVKNSDASIATTVYGEKFCAAVNQSNFTGVQFHPEKSSECGSKIIQAALLLEGTAQ